MNRFQYDNIDPNITASQREVALRPKGINTRLGGKSTGQRKAEKQSGFVRPIKAERTQ